MTDIEFTMRKHLLLALAEWALTAVPSSSQLPVNRCFEVRATPGQLVLAGAGGQLNVLAEAAAVATRSTGTVYLPARPFRDMVAEADDGDVRVQVAGNEAKISAASARWTLQLPQPDGYTGLPDLAGAAFHVVEREPLLRALGAVRHAVGADSGRPAYTQVSITEVDGEMHACASDSVRFARARLAGFPVPLQVPGAVLPSLVKLLSKGGEETVQVAEHGPCSLFRAGAVTLAAVKIPASLPDVSRFLADAARNELELTADRAELAAALRRVQVSASAQTSAVAMILDPDDGIVLTTRGDAVGGRHNTAEAPASAKWEGPRTVVVVNGTFLGAMLAAYPGQTCRFRVGKERGALLAPLVLEDPESGTLSSCQQLVHRTIGM